MDKTICDVVIAGAGPAGATAAILLAREGLEVTLLDREVFPRDVPCAGWLSCKSSALLQELNLSDQAVTICAFHDVTFHKPDFQQSVKPAFEQAPGYLIDRTRFDNALVDRAQSEGVSFRAGCEVLDLSLHESSVEARLADGTSVSGRLFILAAGRSTPLFERAGIIRGPVSLPIWTAQADAALPGDDPAPSPRVDVVLGLDQSGGFGMCCLSGERVSVGVHWRGEEDDTIPTLVHLCRQAFEHKIVPVDLSRAAATALVIRSPASAALDMESHVGKHTIVIGDAGGFVTAASNEGIYPAMWSGQIAARVIVEALKSVHSQDALMTFDSAWRIEMADYLRSPHTDIQFLLPIVFTNQPMTDRMGAAFFLGENI